MKKKSGRSRVRRYKPTASDIAETWEPSEDHASPVGKVRRYKPTDEDAGEMWEPTEGDTSSMGRVGLAALVLLGLAIAVMFWLKASQSNGQIEVENAG